MVLRGGLRRDGFGRLAGERVLHQSAPDFFRSDDRRLFGRRWQHGTGAALQLPGTLGRYDYESVRALIGVVGDGAMCVVARGFITHVVDTSSNLKCFQNMLDL